MANQFSFEDFIERVKTLDYADVVAATHSALYAAKPAAYGGRGAEANRQAGIVEYIKSLEAFTFFLNSGNIPGGTSRYDWGLYYKVAEGLVEKGHFSEQILHTLNPPKQEF